MRRVVTPLSLLLLLVLNAPSQAQAIVFSFLPQLYPLSTSEPATLFLTGVVLLALARIGIPRSR